MRKDVKQFVRALEEQGFTTKTTRKGHITVWKDSQWVTTIPGTPSDHRSLKNSESAARRFEFIRPGR